MATCALALLSLPGCTIVRIGEGADATIRYLPGIAIVRVDVRERMEVVSVRGLGISVTGDMFNLGAVSTDLALVPPDMCSMVLWKPTAEAVRTVNGLLAGEQACVVEKGD